MATYTYLSITNPGTKYSTATLQLQKDLIALGFDVGPMGADGKFGPYTQQAVKDFQYTYGLTVDGIVGSQTASAIKEALELLNQGQWNPQTDPMKYTAGITYSGSSVIQQPNVSTYISETPMVSSLTGSLGKGLFGIDWKWIGLGAIGIITIWILKNKDKK